MPKRPKRLKHCALCMFYGRLTRHHLRPRQLNEVNHLNSKLEKVTVAICKECHKAIHRFITNQDLYFQYYTIDRLSNHPVFSEWLEKRKKAAAKSL